MEIILDCRELKLCSIMEDIKTAQLDVGDIWIQYKTNNIIKKEIMQEEIMKEEIMKDEITKDVIMKDVIKLPIKIKLKPIIKKEPSLILSPTSTNATSTIATSTPSTPSTTSTTSILAIIERKTYSDLYSSIVDGRYTEQKARIKAFVNNDGTKPIIIYIIEGQLKSNIKICKSALVSIALDNICILYSDNVPDTKEIILKIYEKLGKHNNYNYNNHNYVSLIKPCKKDNMTAEICYIQQLTCIPGLSAQIAKEIFCKWPNMRELIAEIEANKCDNIKEIKINNRRISKAVVQKIIDYI